jgi:hypothetical protein
MAYYLLGLSLFIKAAGRPRLIIFHACGLLLSLLRHLWPDVNS